MQNMQMWYWYERNMSVLQNEDSVYHICSLCVITTDKSFDTFASAEKTEKHFKFLFKSLLNFYSKELL